MNYILPTRIYRFWYAYAFCVTAMLTWVGIVFLVCHGRGVFIVLNEVTFSFYHVVILPITLATLAATLDPADFESSRKPWSIFLAFLFVVACSAYIVVEAASAPLSPYMLAAADREVALNEAASLRQKHNEIMRLFLRDGKLVVPENVRDEFEKRVELYNTNVRHMIKGSGTRSPAKINVFPWLNAGISLFVANATFFWLWLVFINIERWMIREDKKRFCRLWLILPAFLSWIPLRSYANWYWTNFLALNEPNETDPALVLYTLIGLITMAGLALYRYNMMADWTWKEFTAAIFPGGAFMLLFILPIGGTTALAWSQLSSVLTTPYGQLGWACVCAAVGFGYGILALSMIEKLDLDTTPALISTPTNVVLRVDSDLL